MIAVNEPCLSTPLTSNSFSQPRDLHTVPSPVVNDTISPTSSSHTLTGYSTFSSPQQDPRFSAQQTAVTANFAEPDWDFALPANAQSYVDRHFDPATRASAYYANTSVTSSRHQSSLYGQTEPLALSEKPSHEDSTKAPPGQATSAEPASGSHGPPSSAAGRNDHLTSPTLAQTSSRRPTTAPRGSLGSSLIHLRPRTMRQSSSDVRQLYSSTHGRPGLESRSHSSSGGNSGDQSSSSARRRAGTLGTLYASLSDDTSGHLRLASSMPDIEEGGAMHFASSSMDSAPNLDASSSGGEQRVQAGAELPGSITSGFESLGLDFSSVQDVNMGEMYGDEIEMLTSSRHSSLRGSSTGTGDASFASTSSSTLGSSAQDDSLMAPGLSGQRSWTEEGTPLSSPAFSAQLQLWPSPGTSRFSSLSTSSHARGVISGDNKGKLRATEFGMLSAQPSASGTWPNARALHQPQPHLTTSAAQSGSLPLDAARRPSNLRASGGGNEVRQVRSTDERLQAQQLRTADFDGEDDVGTDRPSSHRAAGDRPWSMDSLNPRQSINRPPPAQHRHSEHLQRLDPSPASSMSPLSPMDKVLGYQRAGSKRVDIDEVSVALDTLRQFLQQRDTARNKETSASMELPASLPTDEPPPHSRTLRHTSGKLPPRGSVRLDGTSSSGSSRSTPTQQRRPHSSFLSTSDEHSREQDRLDAVQHLSDRVAALRRQSQRFRDSKEGTTRQRQ